MFGKEIGHRQVEGPVIEFRRDGVRARIGSGHIEQPNLIGSLCQESVPTVANARLQTRIKPFGIEGLKIWESTACAHRCFHTIIKRRGLGSRARI